MAQEHPIQGLMQTAMENLKEMVDVNTIVGDPVESPDGSIILPISKVGFGFAAGGSEFEGEEAKNNSSPPVHPFGGGSGGGVTIHPVAFLVVNADGVKIMPLDNNTHLYERMMDMAPHILEKIQNMLQNRSKDKETPQSPNYTI